MNVDWTALIMSTREERSRRRGRGDVQKYSIALNPTLAASVVIVAYKNKLMPIIAELLTIAHLRPNRGISISAVPSSMPSTPTAAIMVLLPVSRCS